MKKYIIMSLLIVVVCTSCKNEIKKDVETATKELKPAQKVFEQINVDKSLTVILEPKGKRTSKGTVYFVQNGDMVTLKAKVKGLTPGMHAIHIHEKADCSSPDGKSAGGHWNPTFEDHGKWGSKEGFHKGDIGNFMVGEDGTGGIKMTSDAWCIGCDDETKNIVGKAIIIHQGEDDFTSQPSGAAGARVSCGGIIK
jgi:Cu-Zn family superoxide dismutase